MNIRELSSEAPMVSFRGRAHLSLSRRLLSSRKTLFISPGNRLGYEGRFLLFLRLLNLFEPMGKFREGKRPPFDSVHMIDESQTATLLPSINRFFPMKFLSFFH